jgi:hypothetical protein
MSDQANPTSTTVDLVTRTGTRIRGTDQPGDWLEVAGRRGQTDMQTLIRHPLSAYGLLAQE